MKLAFTLLFFAFVLEQVEGSTKCVTAVGIMRCKKNPSAHASVAVYLMDRDGIGPIFQFFDPNDLMARTETKSDGTFKLNGCGRDPDLPFGLYENKPDPYILIKHYCNNRMGEWLQLPEFYVFQPEDYDVGFINLDTRERYLDSQGMLDKINREIGFSS